MKTKFAFRQQPLALLVGAALASIAHTAVAAVGPGLIPVPGETPRYFSHPNYANSPMPMGTCSVTTSQACFSDVHCPQTVVAETCVGKSGGMRKFVDGLPGLGADGVNNLGQYIPVATAGTIPVPVDGGGTIDADYYEIELGEYTEQMHSDLPPTKLRGYRQTNMGGTPFHYLGPAIVATKDKPVVIKFTNSLPTGQGGDLFLPVDVSVMGAGKGPTASMANEADPRNPVCGQSPKPAGCYTENRATLHLHGGVSPWISDGTPHQWITPAGEATDTPQGTSVRNVPGLGICEAADDGCQTFYWTNQQSARLMFWHDHAQGITRLNVYAGEAAPYLITDAAETALTTGTGPLADLAATIPLVVQDKTYVPSAAQLALQDETWDSMRWGGEGNLWLPHVYSPAQNPGDSSGVNAYGRWAYGPWFWPRVSDLKYGPIANPYYTDACNPDLQWCEPPLMPGTPNVSMGMEAFMDTPVVNGTAYPFVDVPAGPVRFRILNAANDRFMNLSIYKAIDALGNPCNPANTAPAAEATGVACTEVPLNPAEVAAALTDPAGQFPTPVAGMEGPSWVQIGTEGGFLPSPVVIPPTPISWVTDPTVFNAGNVQNHSLLLAPAERADVIVDFSAYAGQTLILYNDAPAAFPARDPRYDYYTGNPDLTDSGGASSTLPGYGPNTRTVMQIRVGATPTGSFDLAALQAAFAHKADGSGVFESSQNPIIVGQGAYNQALGTTFQSNGPNAGLVQIFDTQFSFKTLMNGAAGLSMTMPLQPKQIQDEMGEAFEHEYGRMSGYLGVETPNPQAGLQNMILYPYSNPPTEVLKGITVPTGTKVTPISSTDDGTQLWKITHNGVDTHPIHFHLYDVQLVNRVGWDGIIRKPDANELGWKDTVRISPLEDTIVAVRPILPNLPFDLPNSVRLIDPNMPEGAVLASATLQAQLGLPIFSFAPNGQPIDIVNRPINFGYEYVWHCHILSHEEMDMMRPQAVGVAPKVPSGLTAVATGGNVDVSWTDSSANETGFVLQRATDPGFTLGLTTINVGANLTSYRDTVVDNGTYYYRVAARNVVGDTFDYNGASFPSTSFVSDYSNVGNATVTINAINAPTQLVAAVLNNPLRIRLNWLDNAPNNTNFVVQRSDNGGAFVQIATLGRNAQAYVDTTVALNHVYVYRVSATNGAASSDFAEIAVSLAPPAAPTNLAGSLTTPPRTATITWTDNSNNESGFQIQRATNAAFTTGLATVNVGANVTTRILTNLPRRQTVYFRVRSNSNILGPSGWSNVTTVVTQ